MILQKVTDAVSLSTQSLLPTVQCCTHSCCHNMLEVSQPLDPLILKKQKGYMDLLNGPLHLHGTSRIHGFIYVLHILKSIVFIVST